MQKVLLFSSNSRSPKQVERRTKKRIKILAKMISSLKVVLALLIVAELGSTQKDYDNPVWSDFSCKEEEFSGLARKPIHTFLVFDEHLMFVFEVSSWSGQHVRMNNYQL